MSTSTWDPSTNATLIDYQLTEEFLKQIVGFMNNCKNDDVESFLDREQQKQHQKIMLLPKEDWITASENLSQEEILQLIRFFTLAEMQFSGWDANEKSPVIGLTKSLRQRGYALEKNLLIWIKNKNPNKFLPFGAL